MLINLKLAHGVDSDSTVKIWFILELKGVQIFRNRYPLDTCRNNQQYRPHSIPILIPKIHVVKDCNILMRIMIA